MSLYIYGQLFYCPIPTYVYVLIGRVPPYASYVAIEVVRVCPPHTRTHIHTNAHTHDGSSLLQEDIPVVCERMVRIVYNDQVLMIRKGDGDGDGHGDGDIPYKATDYVEFIPYTQFIEKLSEVTIHPTEHDRVCKTNAAEL
ncbi:hypothetical protein EON63_08275 [archaeon]|nr:MAG: hypothetical protein EON63_08275 [archaeon]